MKRLLHIGIGLAVVAVFLGHAARFYELPLLNRLEAILYDTRLVIAMPRGVDERVVILDIDEKSLTEKESGGEGRWPWPRDRLALLLDKLFDEYRVAIVGFDLVFAERDLSSGVHVLERMGASELRDVPQFRAALEDIRPLLAYDDIFARKMQGRAVILGYTFSADASGATPRKGMLPAPIFAAGAFADRTVGAIQRHGFTANLAKFQESATGAGHLNSWADSDGIVRRTPMLIEFDGAFYEPLALAVVRALLGSPPVEAVFAESGRATRNYRRLEGLQAGPLRIPVDAAASAYVPYRGKKGSFRYHSLVDVLHGRVAVEDLQGRIVLVGTSAPGLLDLQATPVGPILPGVEIHANLIAGMLDGNIKQSPPYALGAELALLAVTGLALALLLPLLASLAATLATAAAFALVLIGNAALFHYGNLVLPLASGLALILSLYVIGMAWGFFVEARGKRQIATLFGQYVPPALVDEMAENPARFSMEGESRELTVLFADVRGFTSIAEGCDPKMLARLMNEFLTPLTEAIHRRRGTIDKYMGDCIMAFWGAPLPDPQHARNGILAALEMRVALQGLRPHFQAQGWPEIRIGVGLNSGRMSVGNMGSRIRLAYTVVGDAVNLAARIEGITQQYGVDILIGEETRRLADGVVFREIDRVRVKGKETPVGIYEPVGIAGEIAPALQEEIGLWHEALRRYRAQDWDAATAQLLALKRMIPDRALYDIFLERMAGFRVSPPGADWDGAWTFETK
jgi:adenylate cyclase